MKLLCINARKIETEKFVYKGSGLEEGKIYETKGKPFLGEDSNFKYYIEGLGTRLASRFTELLDEKSEEDIAIEKLKQEFQLN